MKKRKNDLRIEIRLKLKSQTVEDRARRSLAVSEKLFGLPAFRDARFVCFYAALPYEVDTAPMIDRALSEGKRVLLPFCDVRNKKLFFYEIHDRKRDLRQGAFGVLEPDPLRTQLADPSDADCVLVPGIVFDAENHRIGHGEGFYDRFLQGLGKKIVKIGLAFSFQVVSKAPREEHDEQLDLVITD